MAYYIVEYERGGLERDIVTDSLEHPKRFKTKRQAEAYIKDLFEQDATFLYKVWSDKACADGDCSICLNKDCPNYEEYV